MADSFKITGAVGLNGQVYRAGSEAQLAAAAEKAEVDLKAERFSGALKFGGKAATAEGSTEKPKGTDWASMDKDDLVSEAEKRGLTVTRGDGKEGDPLKADFVKALEAATAEG